MSQHRKKVKHFHEKGDFHECTFSCHGRMPFLARDGYWERLSAHINQACRQLSFQLVAFVYMPEHVHMLVFPLLLEPQIDRFLARVKQPYSRDIKRLLVTTKDPLLQELTVQERPGKLSFRFWQEGPGYDRNINTANELETSINYIHMNPVKRGLCERPTDWPWSSARYYLLDPIKQQFPELPHVHGLPPGAMDM